VGGEHEVHVDVPGGSLWTATEGTGLPFVLCHGGPGGYDVLGPVAAMVSDVARVHRFDQRGGGRSTPRGPWTITRLVDDMEVAERRDNRLPRLTRGERVEVEKLEARLARGEDEASRSRLRDLMWLTDFADRANAVRTPRFSAYPVSTIVADSIERDWVHALDGIHHHIARLAVPALVLHGEADPIAATGPRELADTLPHGHFVSLPAVGHVPWLEPDDDLRRHLREFLCELG
jgi:proline iminopeptidase